MPIDSTDKKLNRKTLLIAVWACLLLFTMYKAG